MTITEQDIEFFKKAKRIQELWEPKCGDWVLCWHGDEQRWGDEPWLVLSWYCEDALDVLRPDGVGGPILLNEALWLPRQGQLQAMLEERGYRWDVGKLPDSYTATTWNDDVDLECEGPTPSIALGRAFIEVMDGQKKIP